MILKGLFYNYYSHFDYSFPTLPTMLVDSSTSGKLKRPVQQCFSLLVCLYKLFRFQSFKFKHANTTDLNQHHNVYQWSRGIEFLP